jgi:hypothetical protein
MNPGACTQAASLKEAFFASVARIHTSRSKAWRSGVGDWANYISENADFQCTFWHVETLMKKVAVVLRSLKKALALREKEACGLTVLG